jgi:putative acyl-CoA dehydrogenase
MISRQPLSTLGTHEVRNQPPHLVGYNLFASDPVISAALARGGAAWAQERLADFGAIMGKEETIALSEAANRNVPELQAFDRFGRRIDEIIYHPAYHELMRLALGHEVHSIAWTAGEPGGHVAHAALEYTLVQIEQGVCCPVTMTYAAYAVLRNYPAGKLWTTKITSTSYDPRFIPLSEKTGAIIGMAMTEKQGGSDVRSNETRAVSAGKDGWHELTGHKWFCSVPISDAFLTLAQTKAGLSCFLVPRWRPNGTRNPFFIQRLKNKLGDRSNASSEIEYNGTLGQLLGEEGQGVRTIIEMVHHTRLDTAVAAAGLMRAAVVQSVHHASHRSAFQRRLIDQPLMRNVLADLIVEWTGTTMMVMRVASSFDHGAIDPKEASFSRIAVAVAKYWSNKRVITHVGEALECLGGNGYVEDGIMPRLYRQAPLNGIWEGSGNVICLDILRSMEREPASLDAFIAECTLARGTDARFDRAFMKLIDELKNKTEPELRARSIVGLMAVILQASLLLRHGPEPVADAFCASRLADDWSGIFGTLPNRLNFEAIIKLGRIAE